MIRRILVTAGVLLLVSLAAGSLSLGLAHRQISRVTPELPSPASILAGFPESDLPLPLSYINTASQPYPRSMVLEDPLDPGPAAAYIMSHPAFVLEWADGRICLIDSGMPVLELGSNNRIELSIPHDLPQIRAAGIEPYSPSPITN